MAISFTVLTTGVNTAGGLLSTTASISPPANQLILAMCCINDTDNAAPDITIAGNGLTWVQVDGATGSGDRFASGNARYGMYRSMGASPTTGTIVFTHSDTSVDEASWVILAVDGVVTTGADGADAIAQEVRLEDNNTDVPTVTMGAFSSVSNGTLFTVGLGPFAATNRATPDTGYTEINDSRGICIEWIATNDLTPVLTLVNNVPTFSIGLELVALVADPATGTMAASLSKSTFSGLGKQPFTATVASTLTHLAFLGAGAQPESGTVAATQRKVTFAGTGFQTAAGGAAGNMIATLQRATFVGAGKQPFTATMAGLLQQVLFAGLGHHAAPGDAPPPRPDVRVAGTFGRFTPQRRDYPAGNRSVEPMGRPGFRR